MSEREDWRQIQRLVGVDSDGIPGPATARAILGALDSGGMATPSSPQKPATGKARSKNISDNCVDLVKHFEGLLERRGDEIHAYLCPAGVPTIGYGTILFPSGVKVKMGDIIDEGDAVDLLHWELDEKTAGVLRALEGVPAPQNWLDAYVSLAYNIGTTAFAGSTTCRLFKEGDLLGAADAILMWNKGGGKVLPGLVRRRKSERNLALGIRPFIVPV